MLNAQYGHLPKIDAHPSGFLPRARSTSMKKGRLAWIAEICQMGASAPALWG